MLGHEGDGVSQAPAGMPVGWIQPIFQASSMHRKTRMEKPTRKASAVAMLPLRAGWSGDCSGLEPRIMYTNANAREPRMAANAKATRIFMGAIIQ